MADELISQLGARANVLVTDLMEFEPAAGAPSEKGTVTQIFTDASGNLAIDRDARQLVGTNGTDIQVEWKVGQLLDNGTLCVDWANRRLIGSDGTTTILDWNTTTPIDAIQRVFSTATDPNGAVTATKPAICYGDDGSLWVKSTAGPDNTGWIVLISA